LTTSAAASDARPTSADPEPRPSPRRWWRPPAFLAGFAAVVVLLYLAGRDVYWDIGIDADRQALARMTTHHAILLGTSHGHDLSLSDAGFDGADMTHGGQDLFEMAYMTRSVRRRARHLDTVLISLSYFSFVFDNSAYEVDGVRTRVGRRISLYGGFARLAFIPGDSAEYLKGLLYPVVTEDHYRAGFGALGALLTGGRLGSGAPAAAPEPPPRRRSETWVARQAERRCKLFGDYARNMSEHHPGLAEDTFESTLELARELRAASVRVLFFTPPYRRPYNACFDARYQSQTRANGRRLASESGTPYLDFSHDPSFVDDPALFEDSDHLNEEGRVVFSRMFKRELEARSH
jgi:hypothetical protein